MKGTWDENLVVPEHLFLKGEQYTVLQYALLHSYYWYNEETHLCIGCSTCFADDVYAIRMVNDTGPVTVVKCHFCEKTTTFLHHFADEDTEGLRWENAS